MNNEEPARQTWPGGCRLRGGVSAPLNNRLWNLVLTNIFMFSSASPRPLSVAKGEICFQLVSIYFKIHHSYIILHHSKFNSVFFCFYISADFCTFVLRYITLPEHRQRKRPHLMVEIKLFNSCSRRKQLYG